MEKTVVCLGSSTTAAKGTYNWISELEKRPQNKKFTFINMGIGGDLAYNGLKRIPKVIEQHPNRIIILIGGNDILATVFPNVKKFFSLWKKLPHEPSLEWFTENLETISKQLKEKTSAKIAICSLPEVGENPYSKNPIQQKLNALYTEYAERIKKICQEQHLTYIPLYEELHKQILTSPQKDFTKFSFLSFYRDYLFREFLLRKSFDEISEMNGWRYHIDGVHLNTNGGKILVELVQKELNE
jgi:lysophospholipase L1-like esterase